MLTAKGLLSARPRQGTKVQPSSRWNLFDTDVLRWLLERKFSVELLKQFNQLRVAIEPEAAALAAQYADAKEREAISAGLERMEAAEQGLDDTLDADIAFHVAILKASKNPFYAIPHPDHGPIRERRRARGRARRHHEAEPGQGPRSHAQYHQRRAGTDRYCGRHGEETGQVAALTASTGQQADPRRSQPS